MKSSKISDLLQENKTLFLIVIVGLFLLEIEIFALAAMQAGKQSILQVLDNQGHVIHETSGDNLSDFNKHHFEKVFGPLENYNVQLNTQDVPFPFRAWFVAAICLPIGTMLLFAFVVKAYLVIFQGAKLPENDTDGHQTGDETKLESTLNRISRMNIFNIGFLIFIGAISYWIIPNMITYLGHIGIDLFVRFKWLYIGVVVILVCIILWIVYLRYQLAKKSIESQTEIQKHRLSLEYHSQIGELPLFLEQSSDDATQAVIDYKPEDEDTPPSDL
ncbi:MAG: hypothetical protein CSA25_00510 [Desulfobacter postgatei]|uniref:Uncharacterized protein n=1 Tax=Desulfobacter postgatei TaxID=2293 RepID=A0A2G6MTH0_9BACT|nr:MAG: hypothetical protein CSA25_00510 [Desulfobacter postgatei]